MLSKSTEMMHIFLSGAAVSITSTSGRGGSGWEASGKGSLSGGQHIGSNPNSHAISNKIIHMLTIIHQIQEACKVCCHQSRLKPVYPIYRIDTLVMFNRYHQPHLVGLGYISRLNELHQIPHHEVPHFSWGIFWSAAIMLSRLSFGSSSKCWMMAVSAASIKRAPL